MMRFIRDGHDVLMAVIGSISVVVILIFSVLQCNREEEIRPTEIEQPSVVKPTPIPIPIPIATPTPTPIELPVVTPTPTPTPTEAPIATPTPKAKPQPKATTPTPKAKPRVKPQPRARVEPTREPDVVSCRAEYYDYYRYCPKLKKDIWIPDFKKQCR